MCAKWIKNKEWSSRYWQDIKDFESKLLGQRHKGGQSNCNANPIDPRVASNWLVAWLRRPESIIFAWSSLLHSSYFHPFSIWSSNFEPFILERKKTSLKDLSTGWDWSKQLDKEIETIYALTVASNFCSISVASTSGPSGRRHFPGYDWSTGVQPPSLSDRQRCCSNTTLNPNVT